MNGISRLFHHWRYDGEDMYRGTISVGYLQSMSKLCVNSMADANRKANLRGLRAILIIDGKSMIREMSSERPYVGSDDPEA